jgi:hypothetical protein
MISSGAYQLKVVTSEKRKETDRERETERALYAYIISNDEYMQLASIGIASIRYIYQLDKVTLYLNQKRRNINWFMLQFLLFQGTRGIQRPNYYIYA